jgi:hypothetical protein
MKQREMEELLSLAIEKNKTQASWDIPNNKMKLKEKIH